MAKQKAEPTSKEQNFAELTIALKGALMEKNSVDYKSLCEILDGTAGSLEALAKAANLPSDITFYVKPPTVGSFEIVALAGQWIGPVISIWPEIRNINDIASNLIEIIKIKKALKGEHLSNENVQTNQNGDVTIKNKEGTVIYRDERKITNINVIIKAIESPRLNKKLDQIASAIQKSNVIDSLSYLTEKGENGTTVSKSEIDYFKFLEKTTEKSDQLTGFVREIDNRSMNGMLIILDEESEKSIPFQLDIEDISRLDEIVSVLALAEGNKARVTLMGKKTIDENGKIKKIVVRDVEVSNSSLQI